MQVPALIHSVKPALHLMFRDLIGIPRENEDRCLEIYARNLLPNFTSVGNEVNHWRMLQIFFCTTLIINFLGFEASIDGSISNCINRQN